MYRNLRFVYITTSTKKEARDIGRVLVEENLAACVNIIDRMESIYRWKGDIEEATECVLIAKTHFSQVNKLSKRVMDIHSYDCPCVISLPLSEEEGNADYLSWIEENSKESF